MALAFLAYPLGNDIYSYLQYGLMDLNAINPFINSSNSFNSELTPLLRWGITSPYGPVSQVFFMAAASFVVISPVLAVYIFKIFCLGLHIVNTYLIWKLLATLPNRTQITIAYMVNPFILFEQVTTAHNDVFVALVLILLMVCIRFRHYLAGILTIWIGVLTKSIPIIWLPLVSVFMIRERRWRTLGIALGLILISALLLEKTVMPTHGAWKSLNPSVGATASFHALLSIALNSLPNLASELKESIQSGFKLFMYGVFAAYYGWRLVRVYFKQGYSEKDLILDIGWVTLVLFLFATAWLTPWYTTILLPITALNFDSPRFVLTSLTFCVSTACGFYALALGSGAIEVSIIVGFPIAALLLAPKLLPTKMPEA